MDKELKYYKVRVKVGHAGAGFYGDMNIYVASSSLTSAIQKVRHLPKVKHSSSLPLTSAVEVDEKEFVVLGLLKNAYSETCFSFDDGVVELRPLESIDKEVLKIFGNKKPQSGTAKKLVWYATKLGEEKSKKEKKNLCYSYLNWAESVVKEYTEQNENI